MKNKYFCWLFLLFALISAGANAQVKVEGSVFVDWCVCVYRES